MARAVELTYLDEIGIDVVRVIFGGDQWKLHSAVVNCGETQSLSTLQHGQESSRLW